MHAMLDMPFPTQACHHITSPPAFQPLPYLITHRNNSGLFTYLHYFLNTFTVGIGDPLVIIVKVL
jgi:hypothetical protein